jgi:hypothetical protein
MTPLLIIMLIAVVVIGAAIVAVMLLTRGRSKLLDKENYRTAWLKIENNLDKSNAATYQFAILSADKLLDQALTELGVAGDTTTDRLKNAKGQLSNASVVLTARKLRDRIAHETGTKINIIGARRALVAYKKALRELGAI